MEDRKIDEMFRSLQEREITPSNNALKNLQDALNEADRNKKKRNPLIFGWIAAAVAVIVVSIGLNVFSTDKSELDSTSIVEAEIKSETEKIETFKKPIVKSQDAKSNPIVEKFDGKESKASDATPHENKKPTNNRITIANSSKTIESEKEEILNQKKKIAPAENDVLEVAIQTENRKLELLKPIDEAELDVLLQQGQMAIAIEKIKDDDILNLLQEAQTKLKTQGETQIVYSADRLLEQAETELETNKSLQNLLNKAIGAGVAEVQSLFKRQ